MNQPQKIYDYIERLSELLRSETRQVGISHGLQPVQLEVLHYLSLCNRFSDTPMAVTEYLGQTKGTVSQTLKVLEKKQLLAKQIDANDKRVTHLRLTAEGEKILQQCLPTPAFHQTCAQLSAAQQNEIEQALNVLLRTILRSNQMKSFGACHTCQHNHKTAAGGYYCNLVQQPLSVEDVALICREHVIA